MTTEPIVELKNRFEPGRLDPREHVRNVPLEIHRIVVTASGLVFEGECLYPGTYDIPLYADRVKAAMDLVEPFPGKVLEAKALFEENEAESKRTGTRPMYLNWVDCYKKITGGKEPKPFASCVKQYDAPPPRSADEYKAVATTQAIVEGLLLKSQAAAPATTEKSKK